MDRAARLVGNRALSFPWPSWPAWWPSSLAFFYFFGGWSLSAPGRSHALQRRRAADARSCHRHRPAGGPHLPRAFRGPDHAQRQGRHHSRHGARAGTISPDGLTYTFHLRPGIKWSNGDPLTAHDFVDSWERALEPATGSRVRLPALLSRQRRRPTARARSPISRRSASRRRTTTRWSCTLVHPTAYFLELTSFQTLCPVHLPTVQKVRRRLDQAGQDGQQRALRAEGVAAQRLHPARGESLLLAAGCRPPHQGAAHAQPDRLLQSFLLAQDRPDPRHAQHPVRRWCRTSRTSPTSMPIRSARRRSCAST